MKPDRLGGICPATLGSGKGQEYRYESQGPLTRFVTSLGTASIDLSDFLIGSNHDFFDFLCALLIRPKGPTDEHPIVSRLHLATPECIDGVLGDQLDDGGAAAIANVGGEGCPLFCGEVEAFGSI